MDQNKVQLTLETKLQNGSRVGVVQLSINNDVTGKNPPRLMIAGKLDKGKRDGGHQTESLLLT